ncbi:hypothetical protein PCASD_19399 [Puccinia coronata f. sp. avenae]|uniref:Uncharacterized protein n=1 Tax=Puccinia coronata f. sp. avenae TaxID=200324 RepID=A0A2N5SSF4_9BASI|nr:hypothetical protein PCASD_19399 [Puccinia coronata f. sp. avenae]
MASTPPLTTHNMAALESAYKISPFSTHPLILQQFHHQICNIMTPNTANRVLVAETQVVDNLEENHDSASPLNAANHCAPTTDTTPAAIPDTPATTATRLAATTPSICEPESLK